MMNYMEVQEIANKYGVTIAQLCIRYCLQIGTIALPKTANPQHMLTNAEVDFAISDSDMDILRNLKRIENYGASSIFPVYGGSKDENGKYKPGRPHSI